MSGEALVNRLVRINHERNVVVFVKDQAEAENMYAQLDRKIGKVEAYEEWYETYYKVTIDCEEYERKFDAIFPYAKINTFHQNAVGILERFKVFYRHLNFHEKTELSDFTELLKMDVEKIFDSHAFTYFPEFMIFKILSPEFQKILNDALGRYKIPQKCINIIHSLLIEDLGQNLTTFYTEKLNTSYICPNAQYDIEKFDKLLAEAQVAVPPAGLAFNFNANAQHSHLTSQASQGQTSEYKPPSFDNQ